MLLHVGVNFVTCTVLLSLICFEIVENTFKGIYFKLLNEERRSMFFKQEIPMNYQIVNGTIYADGVAHINDRNSEIRNIIIMENAFKNIVAMNGLKYIYKRNFYWRTWRKVNDNIGNTSFVCYKCQNIMNITCTSCNCGYWEIDENPPCPFEIISVINNTKLCVINYNQLNCNTNCPSIISFSDLATCNNPIETRWHVRSTHNDNKNFSERFVNVICGERENCEFSTTYNIFPDRVIFKIINLSNHIIYSRIMMDHNKNYACLNDCGVIKTTKQDQTTLPLLEFIHKDNFKKKSSLRRDNFKTPNDLLKMQRKTLHDASKLVTGGALHCKHLWNTNLEENYEDSEYNDY